MTDIYQRKGLSKRHASAIVHKYAKYDSILLKAQNDPGYIDSEDALLLFMRLSVQRS